MNTESQTFGITVHERPYCRSNEADEHWDSNVGYYSTCEALVFKSVCGGGVGCQNTPKDMRKENTVP